MGGRKPDTPRGREIEIRQKTFRAARAAASDNLSQADAAKRFEVSIDTLRNAMMIIAMGTPEEVAIAEAGQLSLKTACEAIRSRMPGNERRAARRKPVVNSAKALYGREFDADVWAKLRDAIEALVGMPSPTDVVTIVRKNAQRTEFASKKALAAHTWLEEFVNAWTA